MSSDCVVDVVCIASGFVRLTNRSDSPYWLAADRIMVVTRHRENESCSMIGMYSGEDFFAKENVETVFRAIAEAKGELSTFEPVRDDEYSRLREALEAAKQNAACLKVELDFTRHQHGENILELIEANKRLKAAEAELAAERAKPKGGVAWAIKNADGSLATRGGVPVLFASRCEAESFILAPPRIIDANACLHQFGDGSGKLKAALEAKEKAEAEVAAWKEAANSNKIDGEMVPNPATPVCLKARLEHLAGWVNGLSRRIGTGEAELRAAETELAAMKTAPAEVPPLDPWRVLATAIEITKSGHQNALSGTINVSIWGAAYWGLEALLTSLLDGGGVEQPYDMIKD